MCQIVLDGGGAEHNLKERAVKTIKWQEIQIRLVGDISDHLISKGLISYNVDEKIAELALAGHINKIVVPIFNRFNEVPEIAGLQSPPWDDGYIDVFFQDVYQPLVRALAYNQLFEPDRFNVKKVQAAIVKFLLDSSEGAEKI